MYIYRTFVPGVDGRLSRKGVTRSTRATRTMLRPLLPERSYESISRLRRPVGGEEGRGWCHVGSKDVLMVLKAYRGSPKPIARRSRPIGMLLTCCWAARSPNSMFAFDHTRCPGPPVLVVERIPQEHSRWGTRVDSRALYRNTRAIESSSPTPTPSFAERRGPLSAPSRGIGPDGHYHLGGASDEPRP